MQREILNRPPANEIVWQNLCEVKNLVIFILSLNYTPQKQKESSRGGGKYIHGHIFRDYSFLNILGLL